MATLIDGARSFDATTNTSAASADINGMQDDILQARYRSILRNGIGATANPATWSDANQYWSMQGGGNALTAEWQIPFATDQKITGVYILLKHDGANAAGGELELVSRSITAAAGARPAEDAPTVLDGDPWNGGGAGNWYNLDITGLSLTYGTGKEAYVRLVGLAAQTCQCGGIAYLANGWT